MSVLGHSAIGIDVSDGTLKAAQLSRSGRRLTLRRTWRLPLLRPADPECQAEAVALLLRRVRPGTGTRLVLSAPAEESVTRTYMLPVLDAARLAELVRYELLAEVGVPDDDLLIRHLARRGAGEQPVHVYALRRRRLEALQAALARRGVDVDDWELPGFALLSFVELERPAARDRLLLGVGHTATDALLVTDTGLWVRHLALGLDSGAPEEVAARLAAEAEAAARALLPADRPFRPQQVVLLEDGACDARFAGALKKALALPLVRVDSLQRVHAALLLHHADQTPEQALSSARAFGLALAGLGAARFRCPAIEGSPRREALRLGPAVAASVLVAAAALLLLGVQGEARARELQSALPISLLGELRDRDRHGEELHAEIAGAQAAADRLLALARRRPAVLLPRHALDALGSVTLERGGQPLHLERLWLDTGDAGQRGVLSLTVQASSAFDGQLGDRLQRALRAEFPDAVVRGPDALPVGGLSQWTVEIALK